MFQTVPFEPTHLEVMAMRAFELKHLNREQLFAIQERGKMTTLIDDAGRIIMIVGYYFIFTKVIEVFVIPSIYMPEYPITVIREVRRFIKVLLAKPVHRVQTLAAADDQTDKWMERLGFTLEGTLAKYTDEGLDYRQWSIVKG